MLGRFLKRNQERSNKRHSLQPWRKEFRQGNHLHRAWRSLGTYSKVHAGEGVFDGLESVQKKIDTLAYDDHYRVFANTKKEFSVEPRYPGAEKEKPFLISAVFEFDTKNPAGKKSRDDFLRHLQTGAPVEIKAPHLKEFVVPEFLHRLMKPGGKGMTVTLGPARINKRFLFRFEVYRDGEEAATLEYLDFEVIQAGTEEITLSNDSQPVPWKLKVVFNTAQRRVDVNYKMNIDNLNVMQVSKALKFSAAIGNGTELKIVSLDSGFELRVPFPKARGTSTNEFWVRVFEELVFVQSKTSIMITYPGSDLTEEDVKTIFVTAEILRTGHATGKVISWPVESRLPQAKSALEGFSSQLVHSITLNHKEGNKTTIFGIEIPLGPMVLFCKRTYIPKKELARLKKLIANAKPDDVLKYSIYPYQGCSTEARYLNWLPAAEAEELSRLPIFQ